jgi:hypothetical protein
MTSPSTPEDMTPCRPRRSRPTVPACVKLTAMYQDAGRHAPRDPGQQAPGPREVAERAPSRRGLLATGSLVAGSLAVASLAADSGPAAPPARSPDAADIHDDALRGAARVREAALVAAYTRAAQLHPNLAGIFGTLRDHHLRHAARLTIGGTAPPGRAHDSPSATSTPAGPTERATSARATTGPPAPGRLPAATPPDARATPSGHASTLAALRDLERRAAAAGRAECLTASAAAAPLFASITAAETAHADLLAAIPHRDGSPP